ncbi:ATP-grasp domain-containing protein [Bradyrhizobium sp. 21]|uniref:ATP-grasp domain-containing protein n=1 Tax=Bradyrhizobium sp. 21 TaxID=2782666 RepID=UPI001FFA1C1A|nr:ATP-grasp domain-containing protein [Bradyrhizobium sp. 21]
MGARCDESAGYQLLTSLMDRAVCLHDDWNHVLGEDDWDQFDTNPMLLGARRCVMHELLGFGSRYLEYLAGLDCRPAEIISPARRSASVSHDLVADPAALRLVKAALSVPGSCLSTYYSYHDLRLDQILGLPSGPAECIPPVEVFNRVIDRIGNYSTLLKAGVPVPFSAICRDSSEVSQFFAAARRQGHRDIILKEHHRKLTTVQNIQQLQAAIENVQYPLLAEAVHTAISSPVAQSIRILNRTERLFALKQRISNFHFKGNLSPHALSAEQLSAIWQFNEKIADAIPDFQGVFGVDYIITAKQEILAVDFNPRFNSSTYPYFFLQRMGLDIEGSHSRYGFIEDCPLVDMSDLLAADDFPRFDRKTGCGVFIYNPVFSRSLNKVRKWSYVIAAHDAEALVRLRLEFRKCLDRVRSMHRLEPAPQI